MNNSVNEEENLSLKKLNMMIRSDKLKVKQVLMNLFSNAIKYTKENGNVRIVCQYVKGVTCPEVVEDNVSANDQFTYAKNRAAKFIKFHHKDEEFASLNKVF